MSRKVLLTCFVEEHDHLCSQTAQSRISMMSDALKGNPKQTDAQTAPLCSSKRDYQKATGKSGHMYINRPGSILKEAGKLYHRVSFFSSTLSKKKHKEQSDPFFFYIFPAIHNLAPRRGCNLVIPTRSFSSTAQKNWTSWKAQIFPSSAWANIALALWEMRLQLQLKPPRIFTLFLFKLAHNEKASSLI